MINGETMQSIPDLSGMEKAAALLLIMGRDSAVKLSGFFSQDEIKSLTEAAGRFQTLDPEMVSQLVAEFSKNYMSMGLFAQAEKLSDIFEDMPVGDDDELAGAAEFRNDIQSGAQGTPAVAEILEFLDAEPPHVGAFFLSTLDDELSANVFLAMEATKRKELFKLYLDRVPVDPSLSRVMRTELVAMIAEKNQDDGSTGRIESAANLINFFPEDDGEDLMNFINGENPETASILKKSLFKFSSISGLPKETRAIVFDGVESDDIVKALANVEKDFAETVLEVLSQRNRRMVEAELARANVTEEDIQVAQRQISAIVLKLAKEGTISLPSSDEAA